MTVSGYGYSAWGTSPWGAEVGLVSIIRAFAAGDRVVIVDLDFAPQALGAQYPGDALNPASWLVVSSPQGEDRVVAQVEKLSDTRFRLVTLFALGPQAQTNIVSTHGRGSGLHDRCELSHPRWQRESVGACFAELHLSQPRPG